jgi:hypothetical protein
MELHNPKEVHEASVKASDPIGHYMDNIKKALYVVIALAVVEVFFIGLGLIYLANTGGIR